MVKLVSKLNILFVLILALSSCSDDNRIFDPNDGDHNPDVHISGLWSVVDVPYQKSPSPRTEMVSLVINKKAYVGLGQAKESDGKDIFYDDFYVFDGALEKWGEAKIDTFPGKPRSKAFAFVIDDKGYVGGGYDGVDHLYDFYQFDPARPNGSQWKQVASLPESMRNLFGYNGFSFVDNGHGFVGSGFISANYYSNMIFEYDPKNDEWIGGGSMPGKGRQGAQLLDIRKEDNSGFDLYMVSGQGTTDNLFDTWRYDSTLDTWTNERLVGGTIILLNDEDFNFDQVARRDGAYFSIGRFGYVCAGFSNNGTTDNLWVYNPEQDYWTDKHNPIPGGPRQGCISWVIDGKAYVGYGSTQGYFLKDLFVYDPTIDDPNVDDESLL